MKLVTAPASALREGPIAATAFASVALLLVSVPLTFRTGVLLLVAPLTEELVFRAGIHECLLRRLHSPKVANALVALGFVFGHVVVRGNLTAIAVALPALLIGAVYERWRMVWPCVVLHAAMNVIWLAA